MCLMELHWINSIKTNEIFDFIYPQDIFFADIDRNDLKEKFSLS